MSSYSTPRPGSRPTARPALAIVVLLALAPGCAHRPHGTSIDQRPTPAQPGPFTTARPDSNGELQPAPSHPPPSHTPAGGGGARAAADTLAARRALNRCAGRKLLPEQESTIGSVSSLLRSAQAAMLREDFVRAESLARQARQLAGSLGCP